jgi:hypothetical protein
LLLALQPIHLRGERALVIKRDLCNYFPAAQQQNCGDSHSTGIIRITKINATLASNIPIIGQRGETGKPEFGVVRRHFLIQASNWLIDGRGIFSNASSI